MKIFFVYILAAFLISCNQEKTSFDTYKQFEEYVNDVDNGYIEKKDVGDFIFETKLTPPIKSEKTNEITIHLRISRKDGGSVLDYGNVDQQTALNREGTLSFEVQNDVFLEQGNKIVPCKYHMYERNYGLKPSLDLIFYFQNISSVSDVNFCYRDNLFKQGLIRIKYRKNLLKTNEIHES